MHTPITYRMANKETSTPSFLTKGENTDSGLTITEYAFTSPFPMQRNPPHIVKWHPGASVQLGHFMHWGLLMCQYGIFVSYLFFFQVRFSQYTSKESLTIKATLHVLPRPNRPTTILIGAIWCPCIELWDIMFWVSKNTNPAPINVIKARFSKKPVFTWENVSHWQVSTWLQNTGEGRTLFFDVLLFLLCLDAPTIPYHTHVPGLCNFQTALSIL